MSLQVSQFDYHLPTELIAQQPLARRDLSRLMCLDRATGKLRHRVFTELPELLRAGDLLVVNDTRVIPAKFLCQRTTGGKVEGLLLRELQPGRWEVLLKNADRCRPGEVLAFAADETCRLRLGENPDQGRWLVDVEPALPAEELLSRLGSTPLPPYIRRPGPLTDEEDSVRYQTVYAAKAGAVAAPTAGLHFTNELLGRLRDADISLARVTLHVGLGTFAPVKTNRVENHKMHAEWYEVSPKAAEELNTARGDGRRIVAVGTTSVRVLETLAPGAEDFRPAAGYCSAKHEWTDIFIHPPATFRATDALITNFHLPKSTLLMLVAAFCSPGDTKGIATILNAYAEAIRRKYRFYSYGDAMLIG